MIHPNQNKKRDMTSIIPLFIGYSFIDKDLPHHVDWF